MILNHEIRAGGLIQGFNVEGVFVAPNFPIKHVTVTTLGNSYGVMLSGLIGNDVNGKLVGTDIYAQSLQTIENIRTALREAAQHLGVAVKKEDLLSCITFSRVDLSDIAHVLELNRAYVDSGMPLAGRAALEVKKLPLNAAVEITVTAAFPK